MKFDEVISVISNGFLGLGVLLKDKKIEGVITDGDIRRVLQSEKGKALDLTASDFFTSNPLTIDCEEKILVADDIMQEKKITALLVEDQGDFCGILHLYDL